jgi:hypothetical protein
MIPTLRWNDLRKCAFQCVIAFVRLYLASHINESLRLCGIITLRRWFFSHAADSSTERNGRHWPFLSLIIHPKLSFKSSQKFKPIHRLRCD